MLKMLDAGMNIASFNFTLGEQKVSKKALKLILLVSRRLH
jgi:pyruvate kinase